MATSIPIQELAAALGRPPHQVRRWIARGHLRARRIKGARIVIRPSDLQRLLAGGYRAEGG